MASQVPPEVSEPIAAAARDAGVEVYHAELSGRELRVQVEGPSGASVRTCSDFTRALAVRLDAAGFQHRQYALEVSSPGVERRLYEPGDYVKALNRQVRVRTRDGMYDGRLEAAGPAGITLRFADKMQNAGCKMQDAESPDAAREVVAPRQPAIREIAYSEVREAQIRVSDAELFARCPAERNK